jgi:dihydroorotate dehydrogenase (NAD+) catalytic subunit
MPAAGCFGFGSEYDQLVQTEVLGAVVVGPVTGGPRRGSEPPRAVPIPGGVLLHTGLANPGVAVLVKRYARVWARSPVPIIVHVAGTSAEETTGCCRRLSGVEAVAGIELGLPDSITIDQAAAVVRAARDAASRPLIVRLPLAPGMADELVGVDALCRVAVDAGADALTVAAPPRGTIWHAGRFVTGQFVRGRLYGPFVLPQALRALRRVAELVKVPLVGCGGIYCAEDALAFLRAGAAAVQVGAALWHDPACLARIAHDLSLPAESG